MFVQIRGGFNFSGEVVASAGVVGAEWGTPEADLFYSWGEYATTHAVAYGYAVSEAGLSAVAPSWEQTRYADAIVESWAVTLELDSSGAVVRWADGSNPEWLPSELVAR